MDQILHTVVLILHVLGACFILGAAFVSFLVLKEQPASKATLQLAGKIWRFVGPMVGIQILTGIYLAAVEWDKFGTNPLFWFKIALVAIDGLFAGKVLSGRIISSSKQDGETVTMHRNDVRRSVASLILFLIIITIGVLLADL